ncbi:MAG: co-chaperone GroES, partial [Bacteroidota bacterium]|nr:co-chaperone GroES [Bacteroidota bacterium]
TVAAVGPGTKDESITLKVGDTVLYGKYAGTDLKLDGTDYLIMRESDIIAIV